MKKKIFSRGLFLEAFRQLKIVGILGTVLYGLFAVIMSVGINIDNASAERYVYEEWGVGYRETINTTVLEAGDMLVPPIIMAILFVPIMMLVAFSFLNKRNSCDFYHAIPVKRLPMYMSTISAVLAWTCIMLITPAILMGIMCACLPYVETSFSAVLVVTVKGLALAAFVMGTFAIGISLSGTLFTNILVSLMIIVLPRLLMFAYITIVGTVVMYYPGDSVMELIFSKSNVFTQLLSFLWDSGYEEVATNYSVVIPTVIEGLCYSVAGGAIFVHRKSETAQKPSLSGKIQTLLRMIPAYIIGTAGVGFMVYCGSSKSDTYNNTTEMVFFGIVFFVISILTYFIYELITSRKWRAVFKSVKQLPILVGLLVVTFFAMKIITVKANEFRIEPENVKYIEVKDISGYYFDDYDFGWEKLDKKVYDSKCIEMVADVYNNYFYADNEIISAESYYLYSDVTYCSISVKQNGLIHNRYIFIPGDVLSELLKVIVSQNDMSIDKYIPKDTRRITFSTRYSELTNEQMRQLYECMKTEIDENDNLFDVLLTSSSYCVDVLQINNYGNYYMNYELPLSYKTPKSLELLSEFIRENNDDVDLDEFEEVISGDSFYGGEINISIKYDESCDAISMWIDADNIELFSDGEIVDILQKYGKRGCATGENTIIFRADVYLSADNLQLFEVYDLTDEGMEEFVKLFGEFYKYYYE